MKKRDFIKGCTGCGILCPTGRFVLSMPNGKDALYCKTCFNATQDRYIKTDKYKDLVKTIETSTAIIAVRR